MKSIAVLLGLVLTVSTVSSAAIDIGNAISQFNIGSCKAFMDDPSNTESDCYVACETTGTQIINAFDTSNYDTATFTPSEFTSKLSVAAIKYMTQISKCRQVEFLQALNSRSSDLAFFAGTGVNVVVQALMFNNSNLYTSGKGLWTALKNKDYEGLGNSFQSLITQTINYSAPDKTPSSKVW